MSSSASNDELEALGSECAVNEDLISTTSAHPTSNPPRWLSCFQVTVTNAVVCSVCGTCSIMLTTEIEQQRTRGHEHTDRDDDR
mmetsp:Transcript_50412/g.75350  ORF Transcript_50412/g.75350 Transcript_50412/m.75350 type:complete len:84 (+) Transcript_50412:179-430(+)